MIIIKKKRSHIFYTLVILILSAFLFKSHAATLNIRMTLEPSTHERVDTPVAVQLKGLTLPEKPLALFELTKGSRISIPCQVISSTPPVICFMLTGKTPPNTVRKFELTEGIPAKGESFKIQKNNKFLFLSRGKTRILSYNHAPFPPPDGVNPLYTRSAFIHPLSTAAGEILTLIHPKDHYHHLGLWNPWTKTKFEGKEVDFWNLKKGLGTVRFKKFLSQQEGPVFGEFSAIHEHVAFKEDKQEKIVLNEDYTVRVWSTPGSEWIIDFHLIQRCASESPLNLLEYRYGGFGFRARADWDKSNSDYLTSEEKTRIDGHATRSRWCLIWGKTSKGYASILFLSHPENHNHPEPMRIWPKEPIFFNYCPIQTESWTLKPGNDYPFQYRLYVCDRKLDAKEAERIWQNFSNPVQMNLK